MFKHILLPVDDSAASRRMVRKAIDFAAEIGARITAYHALPRDQHGVYGEGYRFAYAEAKVRKDRVIESTAQAARGAGVEFHSLVGEAASPEEGIVAAAKTRKCDVIVMGTHGRRGLSRLALGSVASAVLTRASVPVLVLR